MELKENVKRQWWRTMVTGRDDIVAGVKALTKGVGVHVVYDSVGKDTFFESLDSLRPRGLLGERNERLE